jgi:type IX secretion system PorP/SprF family membrane protein
MVNGEWLWCNFCLTNCRINLNAMCLFIKMLLRQSFTIHHSPFTINKAILFFLLWGHCFAQDARFSQPLFSPLAFNPAFCGLTPQARATFSYRNQWTTLPGTFQQAAFGFDYRLAKWKSGIGALFTDEKAGTKGLRSTAFQLLYAYELYLGNNWKWRNALQTGFVNRSLNFASYTFNDQIVNGAFTGSPSAEPALEGNSLTYVDVAAGTLLYNAQRWLGLSVYHLPRPSQSFSGRKDNRLPIRWEFEVGNRIALNPLLRKPLDYLLLTAGYRQQASFRQADLGIAWQHQPMQFGMHYRGFPFTSQTSGYYSQDALAFTAGYRFQGIQLHYTYDATLSGIRGSGGSHEIHLIWEWGREKERKDLNFPAYLPF